MKKILSLFIAFSIVFFSALILNACENPNDKGSTIVGVYKVEYYFENLENENYSLGDTKFFSGAVNTEANATIENFDNYTPIQNAVKGNIDPDGTTVLKVYYSRDKFNFTVGKGSVDGGEIDCAQNGTYKFGTPITLKAITNAGYTFIGWSDQNEIITNNAVFSFDISKDLSVTAVWQIQPDDSVFKTKLDAPEDIDYDGTYITWAGSKVANVRYVIVTNEDEPVTIKAPSFSYKAGEDGSFTVSVTVKAPEGSEEYLDSDTVTKTFYKIDNAAGKNS